jgi:TPP-dependent pyruvate/acetoin dehydrogenase alpha subunit
MENKIKEHDLLKKMLTIRLIEEELAERYKEQEMRCPMHLCIGQEAIAVGVCENLAITDKMFSNHRAHGHYLAKGGDPKALVAEIYGRETGCCAGRGGSMHLIDLSVGFMGATPIVGGTVPLAVGASWASKLKKTEDVTVIFFGDGCFEEGVVHESMNFAALHKLPVIFVCENNNYSVYTKREERQPQRPIWKIADAHGLNAHHGDGNNIEEVIQISESVISKARKGIPGFIEFSTYRWREHCGPNYDDELLYRSEEEIKQGQKTCPIQTHINKNKISIQEVNGLKMEINKNINSIIVHALQSKKPDQKTAGNLVYA